MHSHHHQADRHNGHCDVFTVAFTSYRFSESNDRAGKMGVKSPQEIAHHSAVF